MDLGTMVTEARLIFGQTDTSNTDITNTQLKLWANEAYSLACTRLESVPIKTRPYTTATPIALHANTIRVNKAKWKAQPENVWKEVAVKDLNDLFHRDPDWENAETGIPDTLYRDGTFSLIPYPPPNAANLGNSDQLKTYGLEIPAAITADADIPDLPVNVTDLFQHYIAYKAFLRLRMTQEATDQLILWNTGLKAQRNLSVNLSANKGWDWHDEDPGAVNWAS